VRVSPVRQVEQAPVEAFAGLHRGRFLKSFLGGPLFRFARLIEYDEKYANLLDNYQAYLPPHLDTVDC
jgi:hypothetical protein